MKTIILKSQKDVDEFGSIGHTAIPGSLRIRGQDIIDLSSLNSLTSVAGFLSICDNKILTELKGLENIKSIGNYLSIGYNPVLKSTKGLTSLSKLRYNCIINKNDSLLNIVFENLIYIGNRLGIAHNMSLVSLSGLDHLKHIDGLEIEYNPSLTSLNGLDNLNHIGEDCIIIIGNYSLVTTKGIPDKLLPKVRSIAASWHTNINPNSIYIYSKKKY